MKKVKKRIYNSPTRDTQAFQTKAKILEAAKQLFQIKGFDRVTIQKLAERADVSMPTIYALFKSKRGILQALLDHAFPQEEFVALVDDSMQEKSPKKRLQTTAKLARRMYDAEREFMSIIRGSSVISPECKALEKEREERRYERQGEYVKKLMQDKVIDHDLTLQQTRDILWVLTGRDLYHMLVIERGWKSDAYEKWLANLLSDALLNKKTT